MGGPGPASISAVGVGLAGNWARDGGCAERGGGPVVEIMMVICEVVAS
jgi:hypothetical protein